MKIGVSSYSFSQMMGVRNLSVLDIIKLAKDIGYDCIEFIDLPKKDGEDVKELAARVKETCGKEGLEVSSYTIGADFLTGSNGDIKAEISRVKDQLDIAKILGAKTLRHDSTRGFADPKRKNYQDAIAVIAPAIREVTEYGASLGIKTMTENHGFFMQDSARVEELIRTVNHPNYGWLLDIGNFLCADEDIISAVSRALPYIFHVHVKDFLVRSGSALPPSDGFFKSRGGNYLRGTVVGHGVVPVAQCLELIKSAGYDGTVSVEFEGMEDNRMALEIALKYLKGLIG